MIEPLESRLCLTLVSAVHAIHTYYPAIGPTIPDTVYTANSDGFGAPGYSYGTPYTTTVDVMRPQTGGLNYFGLSVDAPTGWDNSDWLVEVSWDVTYHNENWGFPANDNEVFEWWVGDSATPSNSNQQLFSGSLNQTKTFSQTMPFNSADGNHNTAVWFMWTTASWQSPGDDNDYYTVHNVQISVYFDLPLLKLQSTTGNAAVIGPDTDPVTGRQTIIVDGTALGTTPGSATFDEDLDDTNLDILGINGATINFTNDDQHIGTLTLEGGATANLPSNGKVFRTAGASLDATSKVNFNNSDMLIDYGGSSPLGTANGSGVYSGYTGLVQSGMNEGTWDGPGFNTSAYDDRDGVTGLGIADASDVLDLSSGTATYEGEPIDATTIIVKYTYLGDANLDGWVDGSDYAAIDFNSAIPSAFAYFNGDFNYDGIVSGDDYAAIDFNMAEQDIVL